MRPYSPIVCGLSAVAAIALAIWGVTRLLDNADVASPRNRVQKTYRRTLAEDLRVTREGVYGVDFVKCASCRLEKRKKGPLTFGGLNVLVMEDLSIVMPREEEHHKETPEVDKTPRGIARRLGISDEFLSSRGMPVRFSGLSRRSTTRRRPQSGSTCPFPRASARRS